MACGAASSASPGTVVTYQSLGPPGHNRHRPIFSAPHGPGGRRTMPKPEAEGGPIILLTGGSGYVGGRLIPLLEQRRATLRCLARDPERMRSRVLPSTEVVRGDVLDR